MATVTKADLIDAVRDEVGVMHREAAELVEGFIETIAERLAAGDTVKISSFGTFMVRDKGPRMGRNPKTGEPAPVVDTLWPLVEQGSLAIPRGGYIIRRGRGRIIVEPARS